jgi:hypothetical protein
MEPIYCGKCNKDISSLQKLYCDRCKKYFDIACMKSARNCPLCGHLVSKADEPPIEDSAQVVSAEPPPAQTEGAKEAETGPGAPAPTPEETVTPGGISRLFSSQAALDPARLRKRNICLICGGVFGAVAAVSFLAGWTHFITVPAVVLCAAAFILASRM